MAHDPRTLAVPPEIRAHAQRLLNDLGPRRAAAALGVSRTAITGVVSTGRAMPGTLALMREALGGAGPSDGVISAAAMLGRPVL